jgi:peptidoglycan L-alanyl-D-glutamate endopeptidase CwlK
MTYRLSKRSINNLVGVDPDLVTVVELAIQITNIDFMVIEGLRTIERQRELVAKGASQTMNSKHIQGFAVDLMAYIDDRPTWELSVYDDVADAMKAAAQELNISICWGGAWHVPNIALWEGTMQDAMDSYIDLRRSQGKRPFIDGPHFELS